VSKRKKRKVKTLLLASSLVLGAISSVSVASADSVSIGVNLGRPSHYWWHDRWYGRQPVGYVYSAPPYAYDDPYWRYHHRYCGYHTYHGYYGYSRHYSCR